MDGNVDVDVGGGLAGGDGDTGGGDGGGMGEVAVLPALYDSVMDVIAGSMGALVALSQ